MNLNLQHYVIGAALVLILVMWLTWWRGTTTVGLPLCYLLSLGMIHFLGGFIYLLPWQELPFAGFVILGFREYFFGLIAFLTGLLVFEWVVRKRRRRTESAGRTSWGREKSVAGRDDFLRTSPRSNAPASPKVRAGTDYLPLAYVGLGILFVVVFIPILRAIPSVGAVAGCGAYLAVVGFCLACWRHWLEHRRWRLFLWLMMTILFPAFTTLVMGFIGYGTVAMLIVLTFVTTFYRPRWQVVLCAALLIYVGLSAFVTYMRDRTDFREGIQAGEDYSERSKRLVAMFSDFELFQPNNEYHLYWIDQRLNQNWLVGLAVANLETGTVSYARGKTLFEAVLAVVPRIIWPDKPVRAGSPEVVSYFTGQIFAEDTSVGVGQVMEFYINFGRWGVILGFFCFGALIRWVDMKAAIHLRAGDWRGFVSWFLPGLSLLQAGGSLVEVTSSGLASIALVIAINKFVMPEPYLRPVSRKPQGKHDAKPGHPLSQALPDHLPGGGRR